MCVFTWRHNWYDPVSLQPRILIHFPPHTMLILRKLYIVHFNLHYLCFNEMAMEINKYVLSILMEVNGGKAFRPWVVNLHKNHYSKSKANRCQYQTAFVKSKQLKPTLMKESFFRRGLMYTFVLVIFPSFDNRRLPFWYSYWNKNKAKQTNTSGNRFTWIRRGV